MSELASNGGPRVFLAGGSGAIGTAVIPTLVAKGYEVTAMTRSIDKVHQLSGMGARAALCDAFDAEKLCRVVADARPEVVINQMTELPKSGLKPKKLLEYYAKNDRVRREGTDNLLAAARAAGARRYIGQSIACWYAPPGEMVKSESEPLWLDAPSPIGEAVDALKHSEDVVIGGDGIEGVVLRYGTFYGPNTWYSADGEIAHQMRNRRYPNIGSGEGVTSFIHIDDAADACVAFVESGKPGVYNVVDDEPATANEWMPVFAKAVAAKPPRRVPAWLAKLIAGKGFVEWAIASRGASNQEIKRELGWRPQYASWRSGFNETGSPMTDRRNDERCR